MKALIGLSLLPLLVGAKSLDATSVSVDNLQDKATGVAVLKSLEDSLVPRESEAAELLQGTIAATDENDTKQPAKGILLGFFRRMSSVFDGHDRKESAHPVPAIDVDGDRNSTTSMNDVTMESADMGAQDSQDVDPQDPQPARLLECCGGDFGEYHELKCPNGGFVNEFFGDFVPTSEQDRNSNQGNRFQSLGIRCSNGGTIGPYPRLFAGPGRFSVRNDAGFYALYVESRNVVEYIEFWSRNRGRTGKAGTRINPWNIEWNHHLDCPRGLIVGLRVRVTGGGVYDPEDGIPLFSVNKIYFPICA